MRLGDFLDENGLTLRAFAKTCGVSASSIHRVRNGEVIPNRRLLDAIYQATNGQVTPADLIGVSDDLDGGHARKPSVDGSSDD